MLISNTGVAWRDYACTKQFFDLNNLEKPEGWEKYSG
jgi:hypothetical protein